MKRLVTLIVFAACVLPLKGEADEVIRKGEALNQERCIEIGLQRHPSIVAAKNTALATESLIGQAQSNYYPQITWTSGYSRISSVTSQSLGTVTIASVTTGTAPFDQWTNSATLSQNIYDFGRTPTQVKISRLNFDSSRSDLENVIEQVIQGVKQTYFGVLQAKRNKEVAQDTVKQFQQHLDQAKGFYEVGTKPKFDVIKAEVDLSTAKLNLIKAENAVRIAMVNLNNAMGVPNAPEYVLEDNLSSRKYEVTLEEALSRAFENRPDLLSVIAKKQSAEGSIDLANANYYPFITGNA
ncbi:MAG TPA: TolC family protein, partial [Thermodesulfovibrionales bacterium]|nr:TolC family protein [Thermodesulfovibrionales bacterium]